MLLGAVCFLYLQTWGLMLLLFLMGTQSTFFGPIKYSIIPQHLRAEELVGGNALVETGTFIAILIGTIAANALSDWPSGPQIVACVVVVVALLGFVPAFLASGLGRGYARRRLPERHLWT